jgi:pyruvate kinase
MAELPRLRAARGHAVSRRAAQSQLHRHTREVFGPRPDDRHIYVMATAPSPVEANRAWMATMLRAGMNVLRINSAHEGEQEWKQLIEALGAARRDTGKECRVLMDLAGPKIRTGPIGRAPLIATWKPGKDALGRFTSPARVVIRRRSAPLHDDAGPVLLMSDVSFARIRRGDELHLRDAPNRERLLAVREIDADGLVALAIKRAYVLDQARARLHRKGVYVGGVTLQVADARGTAVDVSRAEVSPSLTPA